MICNMITGNMVFDTVLLNGLIIAFAVCVAGIVYNLKKGY